MIENIYRIKYIDDCGNKWLVETKDYKYIKELKARFYEIIEIIFK